MKCDVDYQENRTKLESPSKKVKRQSSSSHAKLSYMSPSSQLQRKDNQKKEKYIMNRKLNNYEETELSLDDEQNDEMSSLVSTIEREHSDELEKLFSEGKDIISTINISVIIS